MNIALNLKGDIKAVMQGVDILSEGLGITASPSGEAVNVSLSNDGLRVGKNDDGYYISYSQKTEFFRGLALLCNGIRKGDGFEINEKKQFEACGAMIDVSRGIVYKKEVVKDIISYMASMGLNMFMLYTEDTYKMDKYPWFGYMRGGYTLEELKEIDDYADIFGIEVIPCIQTLGHMERYLRWPASRAVRDTANVLLVGADETYELIEDMFKTMRRCFRSDRIHIGLDETIGIGTGKYLDINGQVNPKDIMASHLQRVCALCDKYNYHPMIWSDMFFRLSGCRGEYDLKAQIPETLKDELPKDIELIYWDYIMEDECVNNQIIEKHFEMERPVGFASAIWTFNRLVTCYKKSYDSSRHQLAACKKNNLKTVFTTIWNDKSAYSSLYTILPALQAYAELCYDVNADEQKIADNFKACTQYDFNDWQTLFIDDFTDEEREKYNPKGSYCINSSFQHFFNDILVGLLDKTLSGYDFKAKYKKYIDDISKVDAGDKQDVFDRFKTMYEIIYIKSDLGVRLRKSYSKNDKTGLLQILAELKELHQLYIKFRKQTNDMWYKLCKPFGNNALDAELGFAQARCETAIYRLESYLNGEVEKLEELEEEVFYYNEYDKPLIEVNSPFVFAKV